MPTAILIAFPLWCCFNKRNVSLLFCRTGWRVNYYLERALGCVTISRAMSGSVEVKWLVYRAEVKVSLFPHSVLALKIRLAYFKIKCQVTQSFQSWSTRDSFKPAREVLHMGGLAPARLLLIWVCILKRKIFCRRILIANAKEIFISFIVPNQWFEDQLFNPYAGIGREYSCMFVRCLNSKLCS